MQLFVASSLGFAPLLCYHRIESFTSIAVISSILGLHSKILRGCLKPETVMNPVCTQFCDQLLSEKYYLENSRNKDFVCSIILSGVIMSPTFCSITVAMTHIFV